MAFCNHSGLSACPLHIGQAAESDGVGGYKMASAAITGGGIYGQLKYESGIHRVQRVPVTESQGRIHTSAASVAVLPQADEVSSLRPPRTALPLSCRSQSTRNYGLHLRVALADSAPQVVGRLTTWCVRVKSLVWRFRWTWL